MSLCEALKWVTRSNYQNSIPISFIKSSETVDQLDPSFMYTQILNEILLSIDFEQKHFDEFIAFCRNLFEGKNSELKYVDEFQQHYKDHSAIWWYTRDSFIYKMINPALRLMNIETIIKIGFFIRDLHQNIVQIHSEHYPSLYSSFVVYRGQGFNHADFNQLMKSIGRLISFSGFLSTSRDRDVAYAFAEAASSNSDVVGIVFEIWIDPLTASTPFANIQKLSYFEGESEILISTHSVYRINDIRPLNRSNRLFQVNLLMTSDTDPERRYLTQHILEESFPLEEGWYRLGCLSIKLGVFYQAQQIFEVMLDEAFDEYRKAKIYHMLGLIKYQTGDYIEAIKLYKKSISINEKILPADHPDLLASYRDIGVVYDIMIKYSIPFPSDLESDDNLESTAPTIDSNIANYSEAVLSLERSLIVLEKTFSKDPVTLATYYDRYGSVYEKLGNNEKACDLYKRALQTKQEHLPLHHPSIASSYGNQAALYEKMGDLKTSLLYYTRASNIAEHSLPANHPERIRYWQRVQNK